MSTLVKQSIIVCLIFFCSQNIFLFFHVNITPLFIFGYVNGEDIEEVVFVAIYS